MTSNKPSITIKRFSRNKVDVPDEDTPASIIETPPPVEKKPRSRKPKKVIEAAAPEPIVVEEEHTPEPEEKYLNTIVEEDEGEQTDASFLEELTNENFRKAQEEIRQQEQQGAVDKQQAKELEKQRKETEKMIKAAEKEALKSANRKPTPAPRMLEDDLFSANPSEILGKEKRVLLTKVKQYKNLFPTELKGFKIKNSPTAQELKNYLDEMECIVDTSNVDNFLTDSIIQCIKLIEGVSTYTRNYNVSGLAELLKANKQFHQLCKQLYIKYNVFSNVPPEYQMLILVSTTAYICKCKNQKRGDIDKYLNEQIPDNA